MKPFSIVRLVALALSLALLSGCTPLPPSVASSVTEAVLGLVGLAVTVLSARASLWLHAHATTAGQTAILDRVERYVSVAVASVQQTLVPQVRAAAADGQITGEEAAGLATSALRLARNLLTPAGLVELGRVVGAERVDVYLRALIEANVLGLKNAAAPTLKASDFTALGSAS